MKIGICGTHCAGKTTLVRGLKSCVPDHVCFIEDAAWDFKREDRVYMNTQYKITLNQMKRELNHRCFISDRTVIDNLAYAMICDSKYPNKSIIAGTIQDMIEAYLVEHPYDVIFFVDEYFPLEDNGNRDMDDTHQRFMYLFMKILVRLIAPKYDIPVVYISGSEDDRVRAVINYINSR